MSGRVARPLGRWERHDSTEDERREESCPAVGAPRRGSMLTLVVLAALMVLLTGCTALPADVATEIEPPSPDMPDNFRLRRSR